MRDLNEELNSLTIAYWKYNCQEDYINTPISVLRYITELEKVNCCTELKDKEVISFKEWLFVNNYKKLYRRRSKTENRTIHFFVKDNSLSLLTESELMQIYNEKVMSLIKHK